MSGTKNKFTMTPFINTVQLTISRSNVSLLADSLRDCDLVVHLAALGNVAESIIDPILDFDANVDVIWCLLEAMKIASAYY